MTNNCEFYPYKEKRQERNLVKLNSSTGSAGPLPLLNSALANPIPVVDVTIDARGMKEPAVLLIFTSAISLPIGVSVTLNFEIKRSFNGGAPVTIGSSYTFSTLANILEFGSLQLPVFRQ